MQIKLLIDDTLLREALKVGGKRTRRETVTEALVEYIHRRRRRDFTTLFGTIVFRKDWDFV
jgi:hypothetical protein